MQYLMKPATLSWLFGRMQTASGLKMALPQSGTTRFVPGSSRNSFCDQDRARWMMGGTREATSLKSGATPLYATHPVTRPATNNPHPTHKPSSHEGGARTCSSCMVCR